MPTSNLTHAQTRITHSDQEHDPPLDFALLRQGDHVLPDHIMCAKCRVILPRNAFKKLASHAQTRAMNKTGTRRLEVISKYCLPCRPKTLPPRKLSPREILRRAMNNDLRTGGKQVEQLIAERIERGKQGIRAGINRRMEKNKRSEWDELWKEVTEAHESAKRRAAYLKTSSSSRSSSSSPFTAMLNYAHAVLEATSHAKAIIKHNKRWAQPLPPDTTRWVHVLDQPTKEKIKTLFNAIPKETQKQMSRYKNVLNVNDVVEIPSTKTQGEVNEYREETQA